MKLAIALVAAFCTAGCALTSKSDALDIHYFTPDSNTLARTSAAQAQGPELRLGRVIAGDNLHEKIAHSDGAHEVSYYDDRRWTERPDLFVRRALTRALFERRPLRHAIAGDAPTLDVEVLSFEEVKTLGKHAVRVKLAIQLFDDRAVLLDATRIVERPIVDGKKFEAVVAAMAQALDEVSDQVADSVATTLRARPEAPAPAKTTSR